MICLRQGRPHGGGYGDIGGTRAQYRQQDHTAAGQAKTVGNSVEPAWNLTKCTPLNR